MIPTILPPTPRQALACLEEGDVLNNGRRITIASAYEQTALLIDGCGCFAEKPSPNQRPIDHLIPLIPELRRDPPPPTSRELDDMARRAGFTWFPGQRDYIAHVHAAGAALVAAEVGCGKTAFALALVHLHRATRALIIAPQGVITAKGGMLSQWEGEFTRFLPWVIPRRITDGTGSSEPGVHITYMQEALLNGGGWLARVSPDHYDLIVVDEAHLLANRDTVMGRALFRMQPRWRYALTATPIGNRLGDCAALARWLKPGRKRAPGPDEIKRARRFRPLEVSPLNHFRYLADVIAPIRKRDLRPDLPALQLHKVMVEPEPGFMERYHHLDRTFSMSSASPGVIHRVLLTKLRNLCAESSAKIRAVAEHACLSPGVIVGARTRQTTAIHHAIKASKPGFRVGRIDSTMPPQAASNTSAAFKAGELDVLLMGIKVAYGHSFPDCNTIHIASLEWSYGAFEQAAGRVYRINSMRPVHAYIYLLAGTIEERMFDTVCAKQSAAMCALYGEEP